ncbi:hypothetical protein PG984_005257 [Apiospora sp. TS-2023a]
MGSSTTHLPIDSEPCLPRTRSEDSLDGPHVSADGAMVKTSRFLSNVVDSDKVPDDIQSCLELVRTCHANVQKLIAKRNEHIDLLTRRPNDLAHANGVIESALGSLQDVAVIVERSRPKLTSGGKTTFAKRFRWTYSDKESFRKHLPLVNHHHNAVSSELAYLGQLGSLTVSSSTPGRNPSFGRVENRRTFQDMGLLVDLMGGFSFPSEVGINTTSVQTASITTTSSSSHSVSRDAAAPPPSYEQSTSGLGGASRNSAAAPSPSIPLPPPQELSSNTDYAGYNVGSLETGDSNETSSSIDAYGLAMMLSDYAPLPETNTSVTIQKTVFNAPVNLIINVNGASGEHSAAKVAEETRAAVQLSLRDLLGNGGMGVGSFSATDSSSNKGGSQQSDVRKDVITVSETRGSRHGKEFVMRSGTMKSCIGKEVVVNQGTNGSEFGKEVLMGSRTDETPHLRKDVLMGSRANDNFHLGKQHQSREPMNTFLPSPPPLPPKTPLPSPAAPPELRLFSPNGHSYHAELDSYDVNKGSSGGNVFESVFELPAEPRGW